MNVLVRCCPHVGTEFSFYLLIRVECHILCHCWSVLISTGRSTCTRLSHGTPVRTASRRYRGPDQQYCSKRRVEACWRQARDGLRCCAWLTAPSSGAGDVDWRASVRLLSAYSGPLAPVASFFSVSFRMRMTESRSSSVSWRALAEPLPIALGVAHLFHDLLLRGC